MPSTPLDLAEAALRRPTMYTPGGSASEAVAFIVGFQSGLAALGRPNEDWNNFVRWLAVKLDVTHSDPLQRILNLHGGEAAARLLDFLVEYRAAAPHYAGDPLAAAEELIVTHGELFLDALRPYSGALPHDDFHIVMRALREIAPTFFAAEHVRRSTLSALWGICDLSRRWALDEGSMLQRNKLLAAEDRATLERWVDVLSYAVMMLLDDQPTDVAFEEYDAMLRGGPG